MPYFGAYIPDSQDITVEIDYSFPKNERLLKRPEFQTVLENGKKIVNNYLILVGAPSSSKGISRMGIIASKKVGNAVARNKVKRRIRESFRLIKHQYIGWDIVVIARRSANSVAPSVVHYHFQKSLEKLTR